MALNPTGSDPTPPSIGNALVGAAGLGFRATAAALQTTRAAARVAARPGTAVIRAGLHTPPGERARAEAKSLVVELDAAGRRDIERARVELNLALDRAADRIVTDSLSSPRAMRAIDRLLESPELWTLVDRIANSPEVLNAVASASVGLTNVVADEARRRTVTADEFAERIARRVLGRSPRQPPPVVIEPATEESLPSQP